MAPAEPAEKPIEPIFPRLSGGPRKLEPAEVARHQRSRLEGAMIEAVARHGFAATTLRELVTLAGVSKSTFYQHFESKQDCFFATFDEIVGVVAERVAETYGQPGDFRKRVERTLGAFMELVVERPDAAALAAVDSLTLGSAGVAHREKGLDAFEPVAQECIAEAQPEIEISDVTMRAILGGINGVVYRRLRSGDTVELPKLTEPLVDWAFSYLRPDSEVVRRGMAAAEVPASPPPPAEDDADKPGWEEPPDSPRSRAALSQRERIVRGAAWVVVEDGYEALSIPAISAAAGTSNQTFYENFNNKRDALLAAFEIVATDALRVCLQALKVADDGPEAIGAALRALVEYIADNRMFARLAFLELPTAGPAALDRADATMDLLVSFLEPERAPNGIGDPPTRPALEAIATGIWAVIQREVARDRISSLPDLAPQVTRLALAPLQPA